MLIFFFEFTVLLFIFYNYLDKWIHFIYYININYLFIYLQNIYNSLGLFNIDIDIINSKLVYWLRIWNIEVIYNYVLVDNLFIYVLLKILFILIPILLNIALITILERKVLGSFQRRLGPNIVGIYGFLQPIADALKLLMKEIIIPLQSNKVLFFIGPYITLVCGLLGWGIMPLYKGVNIFDYSLGIIYSIAISSIGIYGILIAGWSANSKYALMGSLRSTAQMISYELILSTVIFISLLLIGSFDYLVIIETQEYVWLIIPLLPVFLIGIIAALAETNRAPFDLPEAESELVAGFMTEHSASMFVFFFLAEYSNILLISIILTNLYLGGYIFSIFNICIYSSLILGIKIIFLVILIIWIRATFPRIRFDQLIELCWSNLLPLLFGVVFFIIPFINYMYIYPIF